MNKKLIAVFVGGLALGSAASFVLLSHGGKNTAQPYAGQDNRAISSLSQSDVEALLAGKGWGLAKPAELNGYPGPAHILEHADKLALDDNQQREIQARFASMQSAAKTYGKELVEAERAVDTGFREQQLDEASLQELLDKAADIRGKLRGVHLAAHLDVTPLLSDEQKQTYQKLRGYGDGNTGHSGHDGH